MLSALTGCVQILRTWHCCDGRPTDEQRTLHAFVHDARVCNMAVLRPGRVIHLRNAVTSPLRIRRAALWRQGCMALGFATPIRPSCIRKTSSRGAFDYVLESVMTLCVEAYTGERECEAGRAADH